MTPRLCALAIGVVALASACGGFNANSPAQAPETTTLTSADPVATQVPPVPTYAATGTGRATDAPLPAAATEVSLATTAPNADQTDSSTPSDEDIAGVLEAANKSEIALGRDLEQVTTRAPMKQLAARFIADHREARAKLRALESKTGLEPERSATSDQIEQTGERARLGLHGPDAATVDKTYLDAEIERQVAVLRLMDRYATQALSPELRSYLHDARAQTADHLATLQAMRSSLVAP